MTAPICPETGTPMKRGVAPMTISYKDRSVTFEMPGWYCDECSESLHNGDDLESPFGCWINSKLSKKTSEPLNPLRPLGQRCPLKTEPGSLKTRTRFSP